MTPDEALAEVETMNTAAEGTVAQYRALMPSAIKGIPDYVLRAMFLQAIINYKNRKSGAV